MGETLAQKIIRAHLLHGDMTPGSEIALRIDQTLTQDATGTMAYLEFETMGIPRVKTELSVAYVDHNTLQSGRARRSSARTATRPPAAASACWPSARGAWTSRSPWAAARTTSRCRKCSRSTSPARCGPTSRPKTSASSCCASCRSRAASARSSSGAGRVSRRCPCPSAPRSRTWAPSSARRRPSSRRTT